MQINLPVKKGSKTTYWRKKPFQSDNLLNTDCIAWVFKTIRNWSFDVALSFLCACVKYKRYASNYQRSVTLTWSFIRVGSRSFMSIACPRSDRGFGWETITSSSPTKDSESFCCEVIFSSAYLRLICCNHVVNRARLFEGRLALIRG